MAMQGQDEPRKLTLTDDELHALEVKTQDSPILSNAFRLMQDADILFSHSRFSSVVALAVLGLEEIGKYLLLQWSTEDAGFRYDKHKLHQMKQGAVAALFLAHGARMECKKRNIDFSDLHSPEKMADLVRAVIAGLENEAKFANYVKKRPSRKLSGVASTMTRR